MFHSSNLKHTKSFSSLSWWCMCPFTFIIVIKPIICNFSSVPLHDILTDLYLKIILLQNKPYYTSHKFQTSIWSLNCSMKTDANNRTVKSLFYSLKFCVSCMTSSMFWTTLNFWIATPLESRRALLWYSNRFRYRMWAPATYGEKKKPTIH